MSESVKTTNRPSATPMLDRAICCGAAVGVLAIIFLGGMLAAVSQQPPYFHVRDAWLGLIALSEQQSALSTKWPTFLWEPAPVSARGVVRYEPHQIAGGYTLYASAQGGNVLLIDFEGRVVHRWAIPFRRIWPYQSHIPSWVPEEFIQVRRAIAYPDGRLLAIYETTANTPSGCGMVMVDSYGETIWKYEGHAHHDVAVADDGTIYVLTHSVNKPKPESPLNSLATVPVIEDEVTVLGPDGSWRKTSSLLDALVKSAYFRPILCHVDRYGDVLHTNTIDLVGQEFASHHEGVEAGDLMVCFRNLGLVAVWNPRSESIVWATTGPWNHPHDPDPLPNGNILIFDNYVAVGPGHGSALVEFNPHTRQIEWQYAGSVAQPLRSDIRSCQQLLPGGNVLITASQQGRLLEVTRDGTVAWEYFNPTRGGESDELIPIVCGGRRYQAEELPFLKTREELAAAR